MEVAKVSNGVIEFTGNAYGIAEIPKPFTPQQLTERGFVPCTLLIEYNRFTQKLVPADPYVYGEFVALVKAVDLNDAERTAIRAEALVELKIERNRRLDACLWSQAADERAIIGATKAAEWDAYRQAVRDVPFLSADPRVPNAWPTAPV